MSTNCSKKDWLLLSNYLAGALSPRQKSSLIMRLAAEPELNEVLKELKLTRSLLSSLPERPIPHNFTLKTGAQPKKNIPVLFPVFRIVTAVSSIFFVIVVGIRFFIPSIQSTQNLTAMTRVESEIPLQEDSSAQLAAPLSSTVGQATQVPASGMGAGTGQLTEQQPTLGTTSKVEYVEQEITVHKDIIRFDTIALGLGILSLLLISLTIYLYFQERV